MKRKLLVLFFAMVSSVALSIGLAACDSGGNGGQGGNGGNEQGGDNHTHILTHVEAVEATCISGNIEYWKCSVCGSYFSDENAENEIWNKASVKTVKDIYNHDWGEWTTVKEATCKEKGSERRICLRDNTHAETRPTDSLGHNYEDGVCIRCGALEPTEGLEYTAYSTYAAVTGIGTATEAEIIIADEYEGLPVTSIGESAFKNCALLTSVTIPDGVNYIGDLAFWYCSSLESITIPESVTSIGTLAFNGCYKLVEVYNLSSLVIKAGSSDNGYVGYYALGVYSSLNTESKLSTDDNGYVFYEDGDTVYMVWYTGSDTTLTLPESFNGKNYKIYNFAFYGNSSLTSVTIPESVTYIGDYAFWNCYKLVEVYNLSSLTITKRSWDNGCVGFYALDVYTSLDTESKLSADNNGYIFYEDDIVYLNIVYLIGYTGSDTQLTLPESFNGKNYEIYEYTFYENTSITSVTIPDGVTSIGTRAFESCTSLTSITIPNSVTYIGNYAFGGCASLESITVDKNNSHYKSIDGNLYSYDGTTLIQYATGKTDKSFEIPDGVTSIEYSAFRGCTSLESVTIPDSVTSIGDGAFYNCTSLESITIPDSVTSIGYNAFESCTSLTSITIPDTVTSIGDGAFYNCTSLESITIPDSVTSIGYDAFYGCTSLESITIPDTVTSIGYDAFDNTAYYKDGNNWTDGVLYINNYLIRADRSISGEYSIKEGTLVIANSAFSYCNSLESVTIPDTVTSIGDYAFLGCSSLESINIPNSVTSIGDSAFDNTAYYKDDNNWTDGVLYINNYLIRAYRSISGEYSIKESTLLIANYAFSYCNSLESVTIPDGVTSIGTRAFESCTSLTSITIPDSVTSIGTYAFYGCKSLESINIPNSVTSIGYNAFIDCSSLTDIYYGGDVESWLSISGLSNLMYYGSSSKNLYFNNVLVTSITIPDTVTSIESEAFYNCSSLTSVTIPDGVSSIGTYAFYGCKSLTDIYYGGDVEGWLSISGLSNLMSYGSSSKNLYFNNELVTEITIPDTVTSIGSSAFEGCSSLESITIGNGVTSIGSSAFRDCTSLTSITIPDSVTSIGNSAFYRCSSLESITIPNSVTSIGEGAFIDCTSLTSITIPDSVTSIGDLAFQSCSSLKNITIPDSVNSIGTFAFHGCYSLTSIIIGNNVTSIEWGAFEGCTSLNTVYYNGTAEDWSSISINGGNTYLTDATRYYYSESEPEEEGNYWHHVDGEIVIWTKE